MLAIHAKVLAFLGELHPRERRAPALVIQPPIGLSDPGIETADAKTN